MLLDLDVVIYVVYFTTEEDSIKLVQISEFGKNHDEFMTLNRNGCQLRRTHREHTTHMVVEKVLLTSSWEVLPTNAAVEQLQYQPISHWNIAQTLQNFSPTIRVTLYSILILHENNTKLLAIDALCYYVYMVQVDPLQTLFRTPAGLLHREGVPHPRLWHVGARHRLQRRHLRGPRQLHRHGQGRPRGLSGLHGVVVPVHWAGRNSTWFSKNEQIPKSSSVYIAANLPIVQTA